MTDVKVSGRQDKIFCKGDAFMSTVRFTHSPNRPFYLPKNRTAELHYKCLQVPLWKQELQNLDGHITAVNYDSTGGCSGTHSDKTADTAIRRYVLENRINLITETAQEVGGNLAQILDSISDTIQERIRMKREIFALTAQGRLSAWVLILLPFLMALFLYIFSPDQLNILIDDPLGRLALMISMVLELIGYVVIQKIVHIDV